MAFLSSTSQQPATPSQQLYTTLRQPFFEPLNYLSDDYSDFSSDYLYADQVTPRTTKTRKSTIPDHFHSTEMLKNSVKKLIATAKQLVSTAQQLKTTTVGTDTTAQYSSTTPNALVTSSSSLSSFPASSSSSLSNNEVNQIVRAELTSPTTTATTTLSSTTTTTTLATPTTTTAMQIRTTNPSLLQRFLTDQVQKFIRIER